VDSPKIKDHKINDALMLVKIKLWMEETVARQPSDSAEYVSQD
jgi:hypothetical protein